MPIIRADLPKFLTDGIPLHVDLGSGPCRRPGWIGIDCLDDPQVDIVADLEDGLPFLPTNSVECIRSKSVLEHIRNLGFVFEEIWRVLKPGGTADLFVPHFSNPYYYSDWTHVRPFGLYSFAYLQSDQSRFLRKVPAFYTRRKFHVDRLRLVFASPWTLVSLGRRTFGRLVNLHPRLQEFYEGNWCYCIPCYGIQATLRPEK